jgi:hypothetical protein
MPNQIDLFSANYNVNGIGGGLQINPLNYVNNPPNLDIDQNGVAAFLNVIEQSTGINLNAINPLLASSISQSNDALALANEATAAWQNTVAYLQQSWFNLQNLFNGIVGTTTAQLIEDVIPGIGGQNNLLTAAQAIIDHVWSGLTGLFDTNNSFAQLAGAASSVATLANSALTVAQSATLVQAQQTAAKTIYTAIDATVDATFELAHIWALGSMPTITVTADNSAIGYISTKDNVNKLAVCFVAETVGAVFGVYINLYTVNTATGVCTQIVAGPNIVNQIGTVEGMVYSTLTVPLAVTPGQVYAVEIVVNGTGSLTMLGLSPSWHPTNPVVSPGLPGGARVNAGYGPAPIFDSIGAGTFTATTATTFSWLQNIASTATGCLIGFAGPDATGTGAPTGVTVGGVAATLVTSMSLVAGYSVYLYELQGVTLPTGTGKSVVVTLPVADNCVGNSVSYTGLAGFATTSSTNSGGTTPLTLAVTGGAAGQGQLAVAALFNFGGTSALTSFNKTPRWNGGNSGSFRGVIGDATGAGTVNFSAAGGAHAWASVGVPIIGGPPTAPPSTFTPVAGTNIPWLGLSSTGGMTVPIFAPVPTSYYPAGTYLYTLPSWFRLGIDFLDAIAVGGGGGGGGGASGAGYAGTDSTVAVSGSYMLDAAAGAGGSSGTVAYVWESYGIGPGNETYLGTIYYGGGSVVAAFPGSAPGGGGGGGTTFGLYGWGGGAGSWAAATYQPTSSTVSITVGAGGAANGGFGSAYGADGAVWLVARQNRGGAGISGYPKPTSLGVPQRTSLREHHPQTYHRRGMS